MMHDFSTYYFKGIVVSLKSCLELIYTGRFTAVYIATKKIAVIVQLRIIFSKIKGM